MPESHEWHVCVYVHVCVCVCVCASQAKQAHDEASKTRQTGKTMNALEQALARAQAAGGALQLKSRRGAGAAGETHTHTHTHTHMHARVSLFHVLRCSASLKAPHTSCLPSLMWNNLFVCVCVCVCVCHRCVRVGCGSWCVRWFTHGRVRLRWCRRR